MGYPTNETEARPARGGIFGFIKTMLKIGFAFALLMGFGIAALLYYGKGTGEAKLKAFFDKARTADLATIEAELHPALIQEGDPTRIAYFVQVVATHFGAFKSVNVNGFSFNDSYYNGVRHQKFGGKMVFEKAEVPLTMGFVDDKLNILNIDKEAKAVVDEVLTAMTVPPSDTKFYVERAEALVRAILLNEGEKAWNMLADGLQKELGKKNFIQGIAGLPQGGPEKVELTSAGPSKDAKDRLDILHTSTLKNGTKVKSRVTFQFAGFSAGILGISIPEQ